MCHVNATSRACPHRAAPDFSQPSNMLLYSNLLALFTTLCYCESLTSIEMFDFFDDNFALEQPTIEAAAKTIGNLVLGNATFEGHGAVAKTTGDLQNATLDGRGNATACMGDSTCTERSIRTIINDKNSNGNITNKSYINISSNYSVNREIYNNKTEDENGQYSNKVNNSRLEGSNGTSNFNMSGTLPAFHIPFVPFTCPEEEPPANIGPYEVPTQRDMVLHVRKHLLAMYHGFHTKAMYFLKDIKQATQASWSRKMFCGGPTELMQYRRCVRWVGDMSVLTTKSLVSSLETARHHIDTLIQGKICNISAMSVDPIHLIRILAAEKVSLEFALPDFLRQLDACARYCPSTRVTLQQKYLRSTHLTDKDFVIRHYLTQQNYNQQLKQQYKIK